MYKYIYIYISYILYIIKNTCLVLTNISVGNNQNICEN